MSLEGRIVEAIDKGGGDEERVKRPRQSGGQSDESFAFENAVTIAYRALLRARKIAGAWERKARSNIQRHPDSYSASIEINNAQSRYYDVEKALDAVVLCGVASERGNVLAAKQVQDTGREHDAVEVLRSKAEEEIERTHPEVERGSEEWDKLVHDLFRNLLIQSGRPVGA